MTNPDMTSAQQAHEEIQSAIERATDRYVLALCGGNDPVRFRDLVQHDIPSMVSRILRSVEQTFWKRELARRVKDTRFQFDAPEIMQIIETWDAALRATMVLTKKELRQLVNRALILQIDAIIAPIECMNTNLFDKKVAVPGAQAVIIANHLGVDERFVRALTHLAQDRGDKPITADDFRRVARDVDAKEFHGSKDLIALANLSRILDVLGITAADGEALEAPVNLARAIITLCGSPEGVDKVYEATEKKSRVDVLELQDLFISRDEMVAEHSVESREEVTRFLADLGVDDEIIAVEDSEDDTGDVRFILTDEEKLTYVTRAVGRRAHLIEPIMKAIEGVLTWEEVDRAINEVVPDEAREGDLQAGRFRSRL